jgi:limonene-1,2-epoxide hydrolase
VSRVDGRNSVVRADPAEPMKTGREAFVALISPLMSRVDSMAIDEVYVTGTEWDSAVMIKRSDKMSASAGAALAGRTVTVAAFFRVKNRQITEWLDAPVSAPARGR